MWNEYAKSIGTTANNLTQEQKIQAEVNGILQETRFQTGDAAKVAGTYSGQVASLGYNFQNLKVAVGNALIPIAQAVLPGINAIIAGLTKLANVFAQVTSLLFGKSQATAGAAGAQNAIAETGSAAAGAANELADAEANAGDAAKKAGKDMKGVLAGFDELNILADNTAGSLEDAASGLTNAASGGVTLPTVENGEILGDSEVNPRIAKGIQTIVGWLEKLRDSLKRGFDFGLGNTDFNPLLDSLSAIGGHLQNIFTDSDVTAAAMSFAESFAEAVGTVAGSLASVGVTIMQGLFGGVEQYLGENAGTIKDWILRIFSVGEEIYGIISEFSAAFADVFSVFGGESAQNIIASILSIFGDIFGGVIELAANIGRDILDFITAPFIDNKDLLKTTFENFMGPIAEIAESIAGAVRTAVEGIVALYDEHIKPFVESVKAAFSEWFEHILEGYNKYLKPVLDKFAEKFSQVVEEHVAPMIEKAVSFFGKLFDAIKTLWDNVLGPLVTWIIDKAWPILSKVFGAVGEVFNTLFSVVSDVLGGIFDALGGLLDFITGIFTLDFKKAWEGIKSIFSGIWNGIVAILEGAVNLVIKGINGLIGMLNKVHFTLPDWVPLIGGKSFGFNIKQISEIHIPRLANGAVIPPNQQFAAILGDQRSGKNIEAPASLIKQMTSEAISEALSAFGGTGQPIQVNVMLDKKVLARAMVREVNDMTRAAGRPVLSF